MSIINEINGLLYDRLIWIGLKFSSIIYNIKKIKTIHRASRTIWFLLYLIQIVFGQSVSIKTSSIRASKSPFSSPSSLAVATTISVSSIESTTKTLTTTKTFVKYLNQRCDFERIPSRGCHLRESYCSMHRCVCKPDFPINIADRLCLSRLKTVGESCQISQECQEGSLCSTRNNLKVCHCKSGLVYSKKSKQCLKGLRGSSCSENSDCHGENMFCSFVNCECKYGYQWFPEEESCLKRSKVGEDCINSLNCKVNDEFSECDSYTKRCVCGQFLSRKYTLDEVTRRCISCPEQRYNRSTNTCQPERTTVQYSLLDKSSIERNTHKYVYIVLSMAPFVVFALIGFIYRYVNPYYGNQSPETSLIGPNHNNCSDEFIDANLDTNGGVNLIASPFSMSSATGTSLNITTINSNGSNSNNHFTTLDQPIDIEIIDGLNNANNPIAFVEPPPSYEFASKDLPPSYDEAIADSNSAATQR